MNDFIDLPNLPECLLGLPLETLHEIQSHTYHAIKADRQGRGGEPVEDGWRLIAVNEVWDALERALIRACNKGYMPDAMGEEWNAFDWTEAPQLATHKFGEEE